MKKIIALTIVFLAVQAIAVFAGEQQVSSKESKRAAPAATATLLLPA